MLLKRFNELIAIQVNDIVTKSDTYIAFHSKNLEIAEISPEAFEEMSPISILDGTMPDLGSIKDQDARYSLNEWNNEKNPNAKSGKINFGIRSITININQICNLKCNYCAAGGDGTYGQPSNKISVEKTIPQLKYFLESLKPHSKFSISFVGGEPLIHPEAIKALTDYVLNESKAKNINPSFTIVTNGTLISPTTIEILREIPAHVTISLDGVKEKNDHARPSKNGNSSTEMTLKGIQLLNEKRGSVLSYGISAVFTDGNENLLENYHFFKTLNPDWIEFNFPYSEKSSSLQKKYLNQMELLANIAWQSGGETELRKIKLFDTYFKLLDAQQLIENHCGAGKSFLMVDAKNKLYTCPWEVGNPGEIVGDGATLDYEKLSNYSKSLVELNNCASCWAKHLCGGGCMYIHKEHTGNKHIKDILFCERTRHLILLVIMYYKFSRSA